MSFAPNAPLPFASTPTDGAAALLRKELHFHKAVERHTYVDWTRKQQLNLAPMAQLAVFSWTLPVKVGWLHGAFLDHSLAYRRPRPGGKIDVVCILMTTAFFYH